MATIFQLPKAPSLYNDSIPTLTPGQVYSYNDPELGYQEFVYAKMTGGAAVKGTLYAKVDDVASFTIDALGPDPTKDLRDDAKLSTAGLYSGALCYCRKDAGAAGAAPENDARRIETNTLGSIILQRALSAAAAVGDIFDIINDNVLAEACTSTEAHVRETLIGLAAAAITENYWGLFCRKGKHLFLSDTDATVTKGKCLVHDVTAAKQGLLEDAGVATVVGGTLLGQCVAAADYVEKGIIDIDLDSWAGFDLIDTNT